MSLEAAIITAWFAVGACLGLHRDDISVLPQITLVPHATIRCHRVSRCRGKIRGTCGHRPRITVALDQSNSGSVVHEMIHRQLCLRDHHPDSGHLLPDWQRCAAADRTARWRE